MTVGLPPDNHVHTEFSWDASNGSMIASCERAVELGLASIAFTEHVDMAAWAIHDERAAAMAEAIGFRRQADPLDFWRR